MDEYEDYDDYLTDAYAEQWSPALLAEATATATPSHTALFHRDRETLWLNAYPETRIITCTYPPVVLPPPDGDTPGLVREVHIGGRANIADAFYSLTCDAVTNGWQRAVSITPWAEDPWDVGSVLDEGREMPF